MRLIKFQCRQNTIVRRKKSEWRTCRIVKMIEKGLVEVEWEDGSHTECKSTEVLEKEPLKVRE